MLQIRFLIIFASLFFALAKMQAQNVYLYPTSIDSIHKNSSNLEFAPKSFQNMQALLEQKQKIIEKLHKEGYLSAHHLDLTRKNDSVFTLPIYIGNQTKFALLKINPSIWPKEIANAINTNKSSQITVRFNEIEEKTTQIHKLWNKHGYSFAEVQLQNIRMSKDTLYADLNILTNSVRRIDSIHIKGYEAFPIKILHHQFGIKLNKKINLEEIQKASDAIEAMQLARTIRPPEILYEEDKSSVFLYLEKENSNYFDGILGFATNEDSGKIEFHGNLDLSLYNNLNQGEKLNIQYRANANDQQELNIDIETPYLANSPISVAGGIRIYKKDSTYTNTNLNVSLSYRKQNWSYFLNYEQVKSTNQLNQPLNQLNIESLDGDFYYIGSNYTQHQKDFLQPIKTFLNFKTGTGRRSTSINKETQLKLELLAEHNLQLSKKYTLNTRASIKNLWSDSYYTNELYQIGGIKSIRGFDENSIPASDLYFIQTEFRYRISQEIYLHSITDIAHFKNKADSIKDNLIGFGFGIGLRNKSGILNLQIANGTTSNQSINLNKTRVHLSLHSVF